MNTTPPGISLSALYGSFGNLRPAETVPIPDPPMKWIAVRPRFEQFNRDVCLTPSQERDGLTKAGGVIARLNRRYYNDPSKVNTYVLVGSWGKETRVRPPRDIDVHFVLPNEVFYRFEKHVWNRQSAILQEVKDVLNETYPNTYMRGDGQVVMVGFESYNVEVVPVFRLTNGRFWICDTKSGGSYTQADPDAEKSYIEMIDHANNSNLRPLIRMVKAWQETCSVPIKSFQLELIAADFLGQSPWRHHDFFWFDWITRDFFAYLYHRANSFIIVPGTQERICLGNEWQTRAESAYWRAAKACDFERDNVVAQAGEEWQKIFGQQIPRTV